MKVVSPFSGVKLIIPLLASIMLLANAKPIPEPSLRVVK